MMNVSMPELMLYPPLRTRTFPASSPSGMMEYRAVTHARSFSDLALNWAVLPISYHVPEYASRSTSDVFGLGQVEGAGARVLSSFQREIIKKKNPAKYQN